MFYLISRLTCTVSGFVYPTYASYKALKSNDLPTLEVWLMYWVVMGTVMAMESTVEWVFAWFPFYYEVKTLVILWLTLPQIQGSTYIYVAHLQPFLAAHEQDIDAALADAKVKAKQVGLEWLNKAVVRIKQAVVGTLAPALADDPAGQNANQPHPSQNLVGGGAPANGFYSLANTYIRQYGPAAVAAGSALLHPMNSVSRPSGPGMHPRERTTSTVSARQRRAELERELASLNAPQTSPAAMSEFGSGGTRSASSSSTSLGLGPAPYTRPGQSSFHPRSVSSPNPFPASLTPGSTNPYPYARDGSRTPSPNPPRDPVAARIERSFYGFEEIGRDEASDSGENYPPQLTPGGSVRKGGWWFWGGVPKDAAGAPPSKSEPLLKKDQ